MNWGRGIVLAFVVFVAVLVTMVTISMNQDISLVAEDYYKQEITYQDQINRLSNFNNLDNKPFVKKESSSVLLVTFPEGLLKNVKEGNVVLFRPSMAKLDKKWKLNPNSNGLQRIPLDNLKAGKWKVKLFWTDYKEKEYYQEFIVIL